MKIIKLLAIILLCTNYSQAQNKEQDGSTFHEKYQLKVHKSIDNIKVDGLLNEKTWKAAEPK
jgi:hypothetical protein